MKSFLSFCVILILFQSLFLGSLVRLEFPENYSDSWDATCIGKQVVLDPFLLPGKDNVDQNQQSNNEWNPFHFNKVYLAKNTIPLPWVCETTLLPCFRYKHNSFPVFILLSTLRL